MNFDLDQSERKKILEYLWNILDDFYSNTIEKRVAPVLDKDEIVKYVEQFNFQNDIDQKEALRIVTEGLTKYAVHTPHPRYFGLFNPRTSFASILADLITATYNPQMAAWSHAPFAAEVENYLIREFAEKFGYSKLESEGVFCGGGAEANLTAVFCAIRHVFPEVKEHGLRRLEKQPLIYCSAQSHHSIVRGAVLAGLGRHAVRSVEVDDSLKMKPSVLESMVLHDVEQGNLPFMVVATAGTTGPGTIDPLIKISDLCQKHKLWYHADAAYGGAVVLHPIHSKLMNGIEKADSITFDVHKWMSVPMATSMFLTKRTGILGDTFGMSASYMPRDGKGLAVQDPYMHSIQWSRRFIGLKLYLSLIFYGWKGYQDLIDHYMHLNQVFKTEIGRRNWTIINDSPLPVVCFRIKEEASEYHQRILNRILKAGKTWLSIYPIHGADTIRVCFNNYNTSEKEVHDLVSIIEAAITELEVDT